MHKPAHILQLIYSLIDTNHSVCSDSGDYHNAQLKGRHQHVHHVGLSGRLHDTYFKSLYTAPFIGLLTSFASCDFVVGLVWRIFKW